MKSTKNIFLIILSIFIFTTSFAQKQKTEPINSGFVFIDGKYIEPPYVVENKGNKILINGIVAEEIAKPKKQKKKPKIDISKLPDFPRDKDYTKESVFNYRNPKTGNLLLSEVVTYYLDNYSLDTARTLIENYIKQMPGLDTVYIENGRTMVAPTYRVGNKISGIRWDLFYIKDESIQKNNIRIDAEFNNTLNDIKLNKVLIFENKERYYFGIYTKKKSYDFLTKVIPILNEKSYTIDEKYIRIKKYGIELDDFILEKGLIINENFNNRIRKL